MLRALVDRGVALIARLATRGLYRSVEIVGIETLSPGPRLYVANHFNGFIDPVVLTAGLGRLPRFLAKGTLWRVPLVPTVMRAIGVLPVHRQVDGGGDNSDTFAAVIAELGRGRSVGIFPEGTTHDEQHLAPLRTGAARLALDTVAAGVTSLRIVPVGITVEDKIALRSRLVIRAGVPLDPQRRPDGSTRDAVGSGDHEAVRELTDQIRESLASVSPDFDTLLDSVQMRGAADLALRSQETRPLGEVSLARRERLAARLNRLPQPERVAIGAGVANYRLLLSTAGVHDDHLVPPVGLRWLVRHLIVTGVVMLVVAPLALVGLVVNLVPALLVKLAGAIANAPVSKGTNRVLVGIVAFPLTWTLLAVNDVGSGNASRAVSAMTLPLSPLIATIFGDRGGWGSALLIIAACPILGLFAVWFLERLQHLYRTWRAVSSNVQRRGQIGELLTYRAQVSASIDQVTTG